MSDLEFSGRQEAPKAPENIERRLKDFDPRLRLVFNVRKGVWQIEEFLKTSGTWSHVLFWHDGPWDKMEYKPLPFGAEPLILEIQKRDIQSRGGDLLSFAKQLDEAGASERASKARNAQDMMADKYKKYVQWAIERSGIVQRRFNIGGRSATQAIKERESVLRDLRLNL